MRKLIKSILAITGPLALAGCAGVDNGLHDTVVLHYQHVANVHRIDFTTPLALPGYGAPVHAVLPLESQGFWAVFLLCGLDVTATNVPAFYFDTDRFRVQYGDKHYGPLRPYTVRLDDTVDLNNHPDTPALATAIGAEIGRGPATQVFRHGYYPHLDYRFAVYVPRALSDYPGDQLTLGYEGGQTLVLGNDAPPDDMPAAGAANPGIAAHCLP